MFVTALFISKLESYEDVIGELQIINNNKKLYYILTIKYYE